MILTLPYPPSVNNYWRQTQGRFYVAKQGVDYRKAVWGEVISRGVTSPLMQRLAIIVTLTMPDRRRRDLDNTLKALLDAMAYAQVYHDDEQIDELTIKRGAVKKPGSVKVEITPVSRNSAATRSAGLDII